MIGDAWDTRTRALVASTGRDRYPSGQIARLATTATRSDVTHAVRLLRAVAGAYRVPSAMLETDDDVARMRVIASTWRETMQEWTQAALRLANAGDLPGAIRVVNEASQGMERYFAIQREIVITGAHQGFGDAIGRVFQDTTASIARIVEQVGTTIEEGARGVGIGIAIVLGVIGYAYFKGKR